MRTESRKLERLFDMYLCLVRDGSVARKRILDDYAINERTLLRDVNELSDIMGCDIAYDRTHAIYSLPLEARETIKKRLSLSGSDSERLMSSFLREVWSNIDIFVEDPLPATVKEYEDFHDCITMTLPPVSNFPIDRTEAQRLLGMVRALENIRFSYFKRSAADRYQVNAIPFLLHFAQGRWYLVAKDMKDGIMKKYLLEKISDLASSALLVRQPGTEHEEREAERDRLKHMVRAKGNIFFDTDHAPEAVRIRFDERVAHHFEHADYGFSQQCTGARNADGSIDVDFSFSSFMELWFFLLPWLGDCRIMSPEHYRTEFTTHVRNALSLLEEPSSQ